MEECHLQGCDDTSHWMALAEHFQPIPSRRSWLFSDPSFEWLGIFIMADCLLVRAIKR